jgi:hypothetical protein
MAAVSVVGDEFQERIGDAQRVFDSTHLNLQI